MSSSSLLVVDAGINLALGLLLLVFPQGLVRLFGIPDAVSRFYPGILGAVLFGIGLALLIERYKPRAGMVGLGLGGAIAINLSGGVVLTLWLIFGELSISVRGYLLLGMLALGLLGISAIELRTQFRPPEAGEAA